MKTRFTEVDMFPETITQTHISGAIDLPKKPTCTAQEAAAATGFSVRQFRYWVDDGTLLAINGARKPVGKKVGRRTQQREAWRIVVRRGEEFKSDAFAAFLTLDEFIKSRMNVEAAR